MISQLRQICLGISIVIMLFATQGIGLSSFHQDVAFTFMDTNGTTTFPGNSYDDPPLLDRMGLNADFIAEIAGTYVFIFHAGKNDPGAVDPTNYRLLKTPGAGPAEVLLRLTVNGPGFLHTVIELNVDDQIMMTTFIGTGSTIVTPTANTTNPVIFSGFNLYHRCLCSPLVLRQSAFAASRTTAVNPGVNVAINLFQETLDIHDEFDENLGVFTATLPGIYVFMYSFPNGNSVGAVIVNLMVNDANVRGTVKCISATNLIAQYAGTTVVLDLVEGDRVKLVKDGASITFPMVTDTMAPAGPVPASPILFSGFLL